MKIVITIVMTSFSAIWGSYGTFKPAAANTGLKISISSKNFLRTVLEKQEAFVRKRVQLGQQDRSCVTFIKEINQIYQTILNAKQIDELQRNAIMHGIDAVKNKLMQQSDTFYVSQPEEDWFEWLVVVTSAASQVHVYSRNNDLLWMQEQLRQIEQITHAHNWDNVLLQKIIMRVFELCYEIIRLYDGTFVDDFDLLVLSNVIVVIMALRC